jgi:hypothetical protein
MNRDDIRTIMNHEPFVPLKLIKTDGKRIDIPFQHVLVAMSDGVIVFKGVESATSRFARKGYEHVNYESIDRLEPHGKSGGKNNGKNGGRRGHK